MTTSCAWVPFHRWSTQQVPFCDTERVDHLSGDRNDTFSGMGKYHWWQVVFHVYIYIYIIYVYIYTHTLTIWYLCFAFNFRDHHLFVFLRMVVPTNHPILKEKPGKSEKKTHKLGVLPERHGAKWQNDSFCGAADAKALWIQMRFFSMCHLLFHRLAYFMSLCVFKFNQVECIKFETSPPWHQLVSASQRLFSKENDKYQRNDYQIPAKSPSNFLTQKLHKRIANPRLPWPVKTSNLCNNLTSPRKVHKHPDTQESPPNWQKKQKPKNTTSHQSHPLVLSGT